MNTNLTSNLPQRGRIHPLVAGAAVAVVLVSATGIAAMTGLLPTSRAVTVPSTQAVPVAAQIASAPATPPQPNAEQRVTHEETPAQPHVHHHRSAPVEQAPRYANNDTYQNSAQPASRPVAVDPNAGEVVAINKSRNPNRRRVSEP